MSNFATTTYPAEGIFAANVFIRGINTTVTVDDYLPFYGKDLMYSKQDAAGGLWTPVLEKVWAKVNGNYDLVVAGDPREGLNFLTGAPATFYSMLD